MKAVVFVDVQKDFIDGALRNEKAIEVMPKIIEWAKELIVSNPEYRFYATRDTHTEDYSNTLEGKLLPVKHCIEGTNGWMIDERLYEVLEGGWYARFFPRIWNYPKASVEICSESDKDAVQLLFSNKTTATLNCQIGYRIDSTNDEQVIRLHQLVEGKDEKIWKIVQTSLQTAAQRVASQYTPSESVEKFDEFQQKIANAILHDPDLLEKGIDVVSFTCAGLPKYDAQTLEQFDRQKAADLAKRLAEAEKMKYEAEVLKTEANYKQQIAEQKGQAEAQTAKEQTDAERIKKLAEIAAEQKVEVEKLEKEQALIKANRELEIAEIEKQTEAKQLEIIKIKADQKIADAQARAKELELSKALSETDKAKMELELGKERVKWEAIGKALGTIKLPQIMNIGSNSKSDGSNPLDNLINMMTIEKLNVVTPATPAKMIKK